MHAVIVVTNGFWTLSCIFLSLRNTLAILTS